MESHEERGLWEGAIPGVLKLCGTAESLSTSSSNSLRCCGTREKQSSLQMLQLSHPVAAQFRVPAFLRSDEIIVHTLKKAKNNPTANRMVDEHDKTGWESPWHQAPQQLHALKKQSVCPRQPKKRLGTSQFLSPLKQVTEMIIYSLPLRAKGQEITIGQKSPAMYLKNLYVRSEGERRTVPGHRLRGRVPAAAAPGTLFGGSSGQMGA